jgi:phosphatidate cytidylyltransferase
MLRTRVITAVVALPLVVAIVYFGGVWFAAGVGLFCLVAGWEYVQMMKKGGYTPNLVLTLALIALLIAQGYWPSLDLGVILSVALVVSLVWQMSRADSPAPTADWALAIAGGLYIGWGMGRLVALRQLDNGLAWVCLALVTTWTADSFAYFIGRTIGCHKFWPRLSPKKTWEGCLGELLGGPIGAAVMAAVFSLDWTQALVAGVLVAVVAIFGDLSISLMKRHVGVKDSSNLFPGHGGFLDRIDSLLFVSMVVYYYVLWSGA